MWSAFFSTFSCILVEFLRGATTPLKFSSLSAGLRRKLIEWNARAHDLTTSARSSYRRRFLRYFSLPAQDPSKSAPLTPGPRRLFVDPAGAENEQSVRDAFNWSPFARSWEPNARAAYGKLQRAGEKDKAKERPVCRRLRFFWLSQREQLIRHRSKCTCVYSYKCAASLQNFQL